MDIFWTANISYDFQCVESAKEVAMRLSYCQIGILKCILGASPVQVTFCIEPWDIEP